MSAHPFSAEQIAIRNHDPEVECSFCEKPAGGKFSVFGSVIVCERCMAATKARYDEEVGDDG